MQNYQYAKYKLIDKKFATVHINYNNIEKIGSGSHGNVYKAISKLNNKEYAIKMIDMKQRKNKGSGKEIDNLAIIENIMQKEYEERFYHHSWQEHNCIFIKMRLLEGNAKNLFGQNIFNTKEGFIDIFIQLSRFLFLMHQSGHVHLDIKPG